MFQCVPSQPGFKSWRHADHGAFFAQAVVYVFAKFAHTDNLLGLMTKVNELVAKVGTNEDRTRQIPQSTNSLRKKLYFFPGVEESL